jgi:hypothetical protein
MTVFRQVSSYFVGDGKSVDAVEQMFTPISNHGGPVDAGGTRAVNETRNVVAVVVTAAAVLEEEGTG